MIDIHGISSIFGSTLRMNFFKRSIQISIILGFIVVKLFKINDKLMF